MAAQHQVGRAAFERVADEQVHGDVAEGQTAQGAVVVAFDAQSRLARPGHRNRRLRDGHARLGARGQGTERNRRGVDWIEAQLKSYGCTNTERLQYPFTEPAKRTPAAPQPARAGGPAGQGGSTLFRKRPATSVNTDPMAQPD